MMARYAQGTDVAVDRTRVEIERVLVRYGVGEFGYVSRPDVAMVAFRHGGLGYRLEVPTPDPGEKPFCYTAAGRLRTEAAALAEWGKEVRRRWRVLLLLIKAKLEAVSAGVTTVEKEFLSDVVLPGGTTVYQWADAHIRPAIAEGRMPRSLLALPEPETTP